MLKPAQKREDELRDKMLNLWYDEKYYWYNNGSYFDTLFLEKDTYNRHDFVSVDLYGNLLGYINYSINRPANGVTNLGILNFGKPNYTFSKDVLQAVDDIFCKYHFNKIRFTVIIGNPIEATYDKLVERWNGRVVGIDYMEVCLPDNVIYNSKIYEVLRTDYLDSKKNIKKKNNSIKPYKDSTFEFSMSEVKLMKELVEYSQTLDKDKIIEGSQRLESIINKIYTIVGEGVKEMKVIDE